MDYSAVVPSLSIQQHPYPSVGKGNRTSLKHGDTVVLLSNVKNGNLTLGYIVHDPYITSVMNQSVESTLEEKTLQMVRLLYKNKGRRWTKDN